MNSIRGEPQDRRVLTLAAEVAETSDSNVPRLLLKLKELLDAAPQGSHQLAQLRLDIWTYELPQVLVLSLKQDFSKVRGGWQMAAKLAALLSQCCIGLDPPESHEFYGVFLPDTADKLLRLVKKLQNRYVKTSRVLEESRKEMLQTMKAVLDSLVILFTAHDFLAAYVLRSSWLLHMLITDDAETSMAVMATIQSANRIKHGVMGILDERITHGIIDELIYKLTASPDDKVASVSTRTLLVICDSYPPAVELLCARYKGLRPLLGKWEGKGFGRDLRRLMLLLEAGTAQQAEIERLHRAAARIQAAWKSILTRRKLKRANTAMAKFQRSFRQKKEMDRRKREYMKVQTEMERQLLLRRKEAMRRSLRKELETLDILPAAEVDKHLQERDQEAARTVQAYWRGYSQRRRLEARRQLTKTTQAAIKIQRLVRRWMERQRNKRKEPPAWQRPPGLTDERRVELQAKIVEWREDHQLESKVRSRKQQEELHEKVQDMLRRHTMTSKETRKKEQQRQALLARLETDAELMMSAPKLSEVTEKDVAPFTCTSVPIASKARHNHQQELRILRQPWWRKLGNEYQDQKLEEETVDWRVF